MKTKVQKRFVDRGLGFPVTLANVPMVKVRGVWTPDVDYNELSLAVLRALSEKPTRLTGNELRFIRQHFEMTLQRFAKRFSVTHAAVAKWEKARGRPTAMGWATEKDIRLFVLSKLESRPREIARLYAHLEERPEAKPAPLRIDVQRLAAWGARLQAPLGYPSPGP